MTRAELVAAGVSPAEIKQRLGTGALIRQYLGVYRVGHAAASLRADYMAAVRACGNGAVLRYRVTPEALEAVRRREREAHARGDDFRRYTYGDVFEDRAPMLRELRALLKKRASAAV